MNHFCFTHATKGTIWRRHSLPCTSHVTLGSNNSCIKFNGQRAKAGGSLRFVTCFPDFLRWFWAATFPICFWHLLICEADLATCFHMLALFCFSLQTASQPGLKKAAGFYNIFDSLSFIAAMDAGLTLHCIFWGQSNHGSMRYFLWHALPFDGLPWPASGSSGK